MKLKTDRVMRILRQKLYSDLLLPFDFFSRSEHMKQLHREGRYQGTSRIGEWNRSEEKRERMKSIYERNRMNKSSHGYGSEYHQRQANRTLLGNKFQGDSGFIYLLDFPASIKVGFSKDWERRTSKQILGGQVILIISGPTKDLADLEFETLVEFSEYTKLDDTGTRYTEFLDKKVKRQVYDYLLDKVSENPDLEIKINNKF